MKDFGFQQEVFFERFRKLTDIDSTTGYYRPIQDFIAAEMEAMGYRPEPLHKGGIMTTTGEDNVVMKGNAIVVAAHLDDIGLIVRQINANGTLNVEKVGGLHPESALTENVRVYTRKNKVYTGSVQKVESSVHVTLDDVANKPMDYERTLCVVLDEDVKNADDVRALGIEVGCLIALDPRTVVTPNGYIKSRFIDDKAASAILLMAMKQIKEKNLKLKREVIFDFTVYEEIGHGGSWLPERAKDMLAVDIACTGPRQTSDEKKVSVFLKDSRFPYHYEMSNELLDVAEENGIACVADVLSPHYGSDADTALVAGRDIRHAAIGQGTANSHGYERTHIDGVMNTYNLLMAYILA